MPPTKYVPPHRRAAIRSESDNQDQTRSSSSGQQSDSSSLDEWKPVGRPPRRSPSRSFPTSSSASSTENNRWKAVSTWRRPSSSPPSEPLSPVTPPPHAPHAPLTLSVSDLTNKFGLLAQLGTWDLASSDDDDDDNGGHDAGTSDDTTTTTAPLHGPPRPPTPSHQPITILFPPPPSPSTFIPPSPTTPLLPLSALAPTRIIYVRNPHNERSWRGHPGIILSVHPHAPLAHVITLTTWKGGHQSCTRKWANATAADPARFRRWFLLMDHHGPRKTEAHDGLPVMRLRGGKKMPRMCYVDCKRTHWLRREEMEVFRVGGGREEELWVREECLGELRGHLRELEGVESPWVEGAGEEGEEGEE